jgi:iron(III) transport system substrate-binding protein
VDLSALTQAAKAEGGLTFFTAATENVAKKAGDAFQQKYGIKAEFIRLASTPLQQRYAAEADSSRISADLILNAGNATLFGREGVQKGWIEPLTTADLPVITSGVFPRKFMHEIGAVAQIQPWLIAYNKNLVKPDEVPKTWQELADAKYKNMLLVPDPRSSDAYLDIWDLLLTTYGEAYLQKLKANNFKVFPSGAPTVQALGAGEGSIMFPTTGPNVYNQVDQGAPLAIVQPDLTVGVEIELQLTAKARAPHYNSARLFANYILSEEGNRIFSSDPGNVSIYDPNLPKDYRSPNPAGVTTKDKILALLGLT